MMLMLAAGTLAHAQDNTRHYAVNLTTADFKARVYDYQTNANQWKYAGDKPCLVDFWAPWCGPCRALGPTIEELARLYDGQVYVYKLNTQAEPEVAAAFGIHSIPSLLFVPAQGTPQMAQGALPKEVLQQLIDTILLGKPAQQAAPAPAQ